VSRYWVSILLLAQVGCVATRQSPLARAAGYLWSQQAEDGGWHSHTYGLLRSGQSLTPFVLAVLLQVPEAVYRLPLDKVDRALAFIQANTRSGALGIADPDIPDYPNYSTALAVRALSLARRPNWRNRMEPMVAYLRSQQFTEQNGWHPTDAVYGAWGMGGGGRRTPPETGHVDLSMTRYVLEALRADGAPVSGRAFEQARVFVERCQNFDASLSDESDGGFFFSTTEFDTNKAGHDGKRFRSYGTTTADGILALLAIGRPPDDPRIAAAQRWLTAHQSDMSVPGFLGTAYQRWPQGLSFYYSCASRQALRALHIQTGRGIIEALRLTQRGDGSWVNPENLVKEDDPLIATVFGVCALSLP
jgi:hypothetical protein